MGTINLSTVKEIVESFGWKVLSSEYVNLNTQMEFQCPEGHTVLTTFNKIRSTKENTKCPSCEQNKHLKEETLVKISKKKDITRYLVFDQASIISGWCVFDNEELIKYGHFYLPEKDSVAERLNKFHQRLLNMIEIYQPDILVFEDIQLQDFDSARNTIGVTTYKVLAEVLGICQLVSAETNIPFHIISSNTWRSFLQIKGRSRVDKKRSAQFLIKERYDISVSEDEADAICLGRYSSKNIFNKPKLMSW